MLDWYCRLCTRDTDERKEHVDSFQRDKLVCKLFLVGTLAEMTCSRRKQMYITSFLTEPVVGKKDMGEIQGQQVLLRQLLKQVITNNP